VSRPSLCRGQRPLIKVPLPVYLKRLSCHPQKDHQDKALSYRAVNLAIKPKMVRYKRLFQSLPLTNITRDPVFGEIWPN